MKGQDRIIALRRKGRAPSVGVFFDLTETMPWFDWLESKSPGLQTVWIEKTDDPSKLDLRFLIGLRVCIGAEEGREWRALAKACVDAKAKDVAVAERVDGVMTVIWDSRDSYANHS